MSFSDLATVMQNARTDAGVLDDFIHGMADTKVTSRLGKQYWTLATLNNKLSLVKIKAETTIADLDALGVSATGAINSKALVANNKVAGAVNSAMRDIDNQALGLKNQADSKLQNLQTAINAAQQAGAGANGWTASLIATPSGRTLEAVLADQLNLLDFGADPTGVNDSTQAVKDFISKFLKTGKLGYIPTGTYNVKEQIVINMGDNVYSRNKGFRLIGDGLKRSIIRSTVTDRPAFLVCNNDTVIGAFYPEIEGMEFQSNAPFPTLAVGKQDLSDQINAVKFYLACSNGNTTAGACGLELNGVFQGDVIATINTGGTSTLGDALRLRQAQFLRITGSGGNAKNSIHITDGYTCANLITNWDAEEVKTCVKIDTANASSNTFVGGQMSWSENAINATAGNNNIFINPNFGLSTNVVASDIGIMVTGQDKSYGISYQPSTVFKAHKLADTFNRIDSANGRSGVIFQNNGTDKFMVDSDGNNLVFRNWNGAKWSDVAYINESGDFNIANLNISNGIGFQRTPTPRQTVIGSRSNASAVSSILNALASYGLIIDNTTP